MFLMDLHYRGCSIPVQWQRKLPEAFHVWHALHSIFTVKPANLLVIFFYRFFTPPYAPVVHIAFFVSTVPAPAQRRRRRPVRPMGIQFFQNTRDQLVQYLFIIVPEFHRIPGRVFKLLLPSPVEPGFFNFIVTTPYYNTRMMAQPFHLVPNFFFHVFQESWIRRV